METKGPFDGCRDDWQTPGPSGPATRKRAEEMRRPPFPHPLVPDRRIYDAQNYLSQCTHAAMNFGGTVEFPCTEDGCDGKVMVEAEWKASELFQKVGCECDTCEATYTIHVDR